MTTCNLKKCDESGTRVNKSQFPHAGIPSLPSPSKQHQAQTAGLHILFKKSAKSKPTLSPLGEIPAPRGDKAAQDLARVGWETQKGKSTWTMHHLWIFPLCSLVFHVLGIAMSPIWQGKGEKGLLGNGRVIKQGSTWRETAISILLILSAHQWHTEFICKTKF